MIRNYINRSFRPLIKYRSHTLINLIGLSVAICCSLFIFVFVRNEFSYDKFHTKSDRLYRTWIRDRSRENNEFVSTITSLPLGAYLKSDLPQIQSYCRVHKFNSLVRGGGSGFDERIHMVDSTFFDMFDFKVLRNNRVNPFVSKNSILITERIAKKYFGTTDVNGKTLELFIEDRKTPFTVDGIIRESPSASSIVYDFLIPFSNEDLLFKERMRKSMFNISVETYVLVKDNTDLKQLESGVPGLIKSRLGDRYAGGVFQISFQPITDIHLNNSLPTGIEPISDPKYSYILITIGMLIIIIACINYVTLSISLSARRSMEVGIKKVLGAGSLQLIRQFFIESFVLTMISMIAGSVLMFALYKPFTNLIGNEPDLNFDGWLMLFCISLSCLIALLSGLYPAIVISRNNLVLAIKSKIITGNNRGLFRKGLIAFQFVLSIGLIVCALGVSDQLNYLNERDLGFEKENVIVVSTNQKGEEGLRTGRLFANSLRDDPAIAGSSIVMYSLAESPWAIMGYNDNNKAYRDFEFNSVDINFFDVMKIDIVQGGKFNSARDSGLIINETLAKEYGWTDPIGKTLPGPFKYPIRAVVKDFNVESLHTKIKPLVLSLNFDAIARTAETMLIYRPLKPKICIRLRNGDMAEQIGSLKRKWHEIAPDTEFQYSFVDEKIQKQYEEDQRISGIIKLSSVLAVLIACAGLYGIVALFVTAKTKEIAIRKVLGASATRIVAMISKEFLSLLVISACISFPLAWLFMDKWLADFAYRVDINYYLFATGAFVVVLLAFFTIFLQTYKTATANPADKMKSE